jgi:hypothetical protein
MMCEVPLAVGSGRPSSETGEQTQDAGEDMGMARGTGSRFRIVPMTAVSEEEETRDVMDAFRIEMYIPQVGR